MNPSFESFINYIKESKLIDDYVHQLYRWMDSGVKSDKFAVFIPDDGLPIVDDLGREHYIDLTLVSGTNEISKTAKTASDIINFVSENPSGECLSYIENRSTLPRPIFTEDDRIVLQLRFRVISSFN